MNPRKLAAIDIVLLGAKFTLIEYALGVFLGVAVGMFALLRAHTGWQVALGLYLTALGINYMPTRTCAITLRRGSGAQAEIADELHDRRRVRPGRDA
jgi:hypothetical protein